MLYNKFRPRDNFGTIHLMLTLTWLALACWTLGILSIGSFKTETSLDLQGICIVGLGAYGYRGRGLAPSQCVFLHAASVWMLFFCVFFTTEDCFVSGRK